MVNQCTLNVNCYQVHNINKKILKDVGEKVDIANAAMVKLVPW